MKNLNEKQTRIDLLNQYFEGLEKQGYKKEVYKDLFIFSGVIDSKNLLKVYRGTSTNAICFINFNSYERLELKIKDLKESADYREKRKQDEKGNKKLSAHAGAAKMIREELKKAFSAVKFQVVSDSYAGGSSIRVKYTDGAPIDAVTDITCKYEYGSFNGMEDIYEYTNSRDDIPQVKYIFVDREMSEETKTKIQTILTEKWGENYKTEHWQNAYRMEREEFDKMIFNTGEVKEEAKTSEEQKKDIEPVQVADDEIKVIQYSEKAIAIIGNTKKFKDKLKEMGGRFNSNLTCGAGWIFPKTKIDLIKKTLTA